MIQGKTPEITIKFSSVPELPTEGKKVTVEILSENGIKVKAELNRKTLKKQVAKMEESENWVGAMSGKIKSLSPEGMIELESAGIQIFEKKNTNREAKSEGSSPAQEAKSSSAADSDKIKSESAEKKEEKESSTEKKQNEKPIFQAVGIIEGAVESIDNKLKVSIGAESYDLKFIPGHKKRQWSKLEQEIEEKGSCSKTMMVYPQSNINKKGEVKMSFALSSVRTAEKSNSNLELIAGEFKLAGLWQYPPKWNSPCISIRRNWEEGFVSYLEKIEEKQKAYILRANYLPVDWSNPPTEALKYSAETVAAGKKADFVSVKARFESEENKFKVVEVLAEPTQTIPRYLKA